MVTIQRLKIITFSGLINMNINWTIAGELRDFTGFDIPTAKEVMGDLLLNVPDFTIGGYRFIHSMAIDKIMVNDLNKDDHGLGYYETNFLANLMQVDVGIVRELQKLGEYELVGKLVKRLDKVEELQKQYVLDNGYGDHFGKYDGNYLDIVDYYIFKVG